MSAIGKRPKPWDARLAGMLVAPLVRSPLTPNHFTTLRLLAGLASAVVFAIGKAPNVAAWLFVLSHFVDHIDGELARQSGRTSRLGHFYDLASDAVVMIALFPGIGWGLARGDLGNRAVMMGFIAGVSVALIFQLRYAIEERQGKAAIRQPGLSGFEVDDVLYLLPLVTITGTLQPFLHAAAVGAPCALLLVLILFLRTRYSTAS